MSRADLSAPAGAPSSDEPGGSHAPAVRRAGLILGALVFLALAFLPSPLRDLPGFGARPAGAAAVAALMAVLWFTEAWPIHLTACLPLLLYPLLGVFGPGLGRNLAASAAPFADAYIFLFLGGMAIGAALEHSGLHRRVALHILRAVGTDPARLLLGVLLATAAVSLWISNTATAVMMLPVAMALVRQLESAAGGERLWRYGTAVLLAVAYGANLGGIGTKIGTGTNSIYLGWVSNHLGVDIGFLRYMLVALPFVLLFLPVVWLVLWRYARSGAPRTGSGRDVLEREIAALGAMSRGERQVAVVFVVAALLWITGDLWRAPLAPWLPTPWEGFRLQGKHGEAAVAMVSALVLVLLGQLPLRALRRVPWSTLLLLGGSFAMAEGITASGLASWLSGRMAGLAAMSGLAQLAVASAATVALSAVASNTATISVLLNVLPRSLPVLTAAAIAASCDFMLPAGTPPNAIVFGSGYIRLPVMIRLGFVLDVLAAASIAVYAHLWIRAVL